MKKTLVAALTSAMVIGAASTTFAAANPFSDVPMDHWAYDAVSQLAADGVIEGYGDTTFRGQQNITRYEMAQMIAKAMAKTNVSGADQALINKLAAEFADELNNLGVRVSNLEKHADKVKWSGKAEYTYMSIRDDGEKDNTDNLLFRLEPSAEVNDHWTVNARVDVNTDLAHDRDMNNNNEDGAKADFNRAYAEGNYGNFMVRLGKQELYTNEGEGQLGGLLFDDEFSGAAVTFGNELKATLLGGRFDGAKNGAYEFTDTASLQGINLQYEPNKLHIGAGYYHLNSYDFADKNNAFNTDYGYGDSDDANIWSVNAGYDFDGSSKLFGAYANNTEADDNDYSWQAEYDYKGADGMNKGTWGAWAGYRYLGANVSPFATQDEAQWNTKGWVIGTNYTLTKNVVATAKYFNGENITDGADAETLFGRVEFLF